MGGVGRWDDAPVSTILRSANMIGICSLRASVARPATLWRGRTALHANPDLASSPSITRTHLTWSPLPRWASLHWHTLAPLLACPGLVHACHAAMLHAAMLQSSHASGCFARLSYRCSPAARPPACLSIHLLALGPPSSPPRPPKNAREGGQAQGYRCGRNRGRLPGKADRHRHARGSYARCPPPAPPGLVNRSRT